MKDHLLDLVEHTYDLGCIDLIKIIGDANNTSIAGIAGDQSVVVQAQFKNPVPEFVGTFGMPNLSKLKILLNLEAYKENAKLTMSQKDGVPDSVNFENATGDFKNSYRLMSEAVVNKMLKSARFKGANWHIDFVPTVASIQRLKMQAQANAEEPNFQAKTEDGHLKFFFGDHSTHSGTFVFQHDVGGTLKRAWSWPVAQFIAIMNLSGDKRVQISDDGAAMITVDSGLAVYEYIIPAQSK